MEGNEGSKLIVDLLSRQQRRERDPFFAPLTSAGEIEISTLECNSTSRRKADSQGCGEELIRSGPQFEKLIFPGQFPNRIPLRSYKLVSNQLAAKSFSIGMMGSEGPLPSLPECPMNKKVESLGMRRIEVIICIRGTTTIQIYRQIWD